MQFSNSFELVYVFYGKKNGKYPKVTNDQNDDFFFKADFFIEFLRKIPI